MKITHENIVTLLSPICKNIGGTISSFNKTGYPCYDTRPSVREFYLKGSQPFNVTSSPLKLDVLSMMFSNVECENGILIFDKVLAINFNEDNGQ